MARCVGPNLGPGRGPPASVGSVADAAIETSGLTKFYGRHRALSDLDLRVEKGEVFGFLGPNGAGKSTTIRILLDLLRPSSGRATVLGLDPRARSLELRSRLGYVPGDLALPEHLTGRQLCRYFGRLRGLPGTGRMTELAERLQLDLDRTIGDYSTGNRQKVCLVQAFMHDPELLILDEPTSGLDPLMQQAFYSLVDEARDDGRTVFLSSHVLPEVEHVAGRVAIIRGGELAVVEELAALKAQAVRRLDLDFAHPVDAATFERLDSVVAASTADDGHRLSLQVTGTVDEVIKAAAHHTVHGITSHEADLEELFLGYYRGEDPEPDEETAP